MQAQGTSEHITMLCTASAASLPLPPMIINSKPLPGRQYHFEGPDNALNAKSNLVGSIRWTWMKKSFLNVSPHTVQLVSSLMVRMEQLV